MKDVRRGLTMKKPTRHFCPDSVYRMMKDCWNIDPSERPAFAELYDRLATHERYQDGQLVNVNGHYAEAEHRQNSKFSGY